MSFNDIKYAAFGTLIAEIVTLPICTIRTNYINNKLKSPISTIKNIYSNRGIYGFYQASLPALSGQVISTSCKYFTYHRYKKITENLSIDNTLGSIISGSLGGITVSFITHPIDVIKVNKQMGTRNYSIKNFYRGFTPTLCKAGFSGALFFPLQEIILRKTNNVDLSSCLTSIIATIAMQPLDYVKIRRISDHNFTFKGLAKEIIGGDIKINELYRGLSLNLCRIVPHFIIVMKVIHYLNR